VGIANVWCFRYQTGGWQRQETKRLYKAAIDKALELDNTLAETHAVLAAYKCFTEWDWENAEKGFQQALRLNPNLADAHSTYSHLLCIMGRTEEALPHSERAIKLDPLSPFINYFYGMVLGFNRRIDDTLAAFRTVLEIEPNFWLALLGQADLLGLKGMYDEQLAIYRKIYADDAEITAALEDGFKKASYNGAFRAVADLMAEWYGKPGKSESAFDIALWYQRAGDYEEAIDWFEKAYEEHDPNLPYIRLFGGDALRSDPRFQELLCKMNLPVDEKE
jgi:adenylate cyclase